MWGVEFTDEFNNWWENISEREQEDVTAVVQLLEKSGPGLSFPHSSDVRGSRHGRMRELRVRTGRQRLRIFYAFDPRRYAILLIGGNKTGDDRFYETYVPKADDLYDEHLDELRQEGLIT